MHADEHAYNQPQKKTMAQTYARRSNAKLVWSNQNPMDCEERLLSQAKLVKNVNPGTRTFVYRNLVKALPWYSSVREKITDPAYRSVSQ